MFRLLVILFVIKFYAQTDIFKLLKFVLLHFVARLIRRVCIFIWQLTPFHNPTTIYRTRIFISTTLFLAYGKCSNSQLLARYLRSQKLGVMLVIHSLSDCSPRNYWQQKAIAAEIAFQVKIIGSKNLLSSLFSLKYNNKKEL